MLMTLLLIHYHNPNQTKLIPKYNQNHGLNKSLKPIHTHWNCFNQTQPKTNKIAPQKLLDQTPIWGHAITQEQFLVVTSINLKSKVNQRNTFH